MKPIALDTADFALMKARGCIYVDKTDMLLRLINDPGARLFFISRPRRFGKSLMLSTLRNIFEGKRDLFEGTAIYDADHDWQTYPVIHLDMSLVNANSMEEFDASLVSVVRNAVQAAGATYRDDGLPSSNFGDAITELAARHGKPVVLLIDEYDAPVAHAMDDLEKANTFRSKLASLYIQIKGHERDVRFMMMTGVTKFTQLSVFSALNNLVDLTFSEKTATLLGYTEEELEAYFSEHMHAHAEVMGLEYEAYRAELRRWYNGYRFSPFNATSVYNPVSVGKTLADRRPVFGATWAQTGHASALMNALKREPLLVRDYERVTEISEDIFSVYDLATIDPTVLLYQAGYLTIKDYDLITQFYTLGVPDEEVRRDLNGLLVKIADPIDGKAAGNRMVAALARGEVDDALAHLKAFFAHLTYGSHEGQIYEANYQRILFTFLSAARFSVTAEDHQTSGRADVVAQFGDRTFIFELKVSRPAQEALEQILAKNYAAPYLRPGKKVTAIGLSFDPATHQLADTAWQQLSCE